MNWTTTDHQTGNGHTDLGPAPALGSDGGGAPTKRAARATKPQPNYVRSVFADAAVRELVAAACEDQVTALLQVPEHETSVQRASRLDAIRRLDSVADELRPASDDEGEG